jgi:RimJ/RimL family protein N-acetyltransferase
MEDIVRIETERFTLRSWRPADLAPLAAMHSDPEVMHDHPSPLSRTESDVKLAKYQAAIESLGYGRMALEAEGQFLGYVGIMPIWPEHAVAPGVEVGWRLVRRAWGRGFATEAARSALRHGFETHGFREVLSYTSPTNWRSRAVMERLKLSRDPMRDFSYSVDGHSYEGIVFVARPNQF